MEVELSCPKTGKTSTEPISADFLNIANFPFWAHILQLNLKIKILTEMSNLKIHESST